MSEISFHESDFDFDDAAHGGGTISGEVFEADGAILTPASSDTESRDEAPADPLTSTNLAAQAAAQAIRHGSNDIISLNEDSDTDSTNTLVRVFAGLSVSDQKLVLAAAARTQMFKRLDRAIQEKSLRAVVGSTTGTSTRVSSTTSSGNGRAQRNALVVSPSVGQAVSTARAPAENGPSGRAFTRDLARYLRSETKGTADIRGLRGWQAICTTIGAVPTENSIPACIRVCSFLVQHSP